MKEITDTQRLEWFILNEAKLSIGLWHEPLQTLSFLQRLELGRYAPSFRIEWKDDIGIKKTLPAESRFKTVREAIDAAMMTDAVKDFLSDGETNG